ncbi:MAG: hypothetical protein PHX72_00075 [Candidatus Shapirobacteria bacterium]|nr:hypothetical protein [Candidatus Shapirobacteria bacterium]
MKRQLLLVTLFIFAFCFLFVRNAQALVSGTDLETELESSNWQLGSHTFGTVTRITDSLSILIAGSSSNETVNQAVGSGAIQATGNLIAALYSHPPASSIEYFADLGRSLDIIKPTYAQGIGFNGLRPILSLWKNFRNIAYFFFILVFIILGFAIMFRLKINPQMVVTIQAAIPKVITALILVTFSYAIAGLLIDLMYLVTAIGISAIGGGDLFLEGVLQFLQDLGISPGGIENLNMLTFSFFFWGRASSSINQISQMFTPASLIASILGIQIPQAVEQILSVFPTIPWLNPVGSILRLVLSIIILFIFFKIFISLILCYIRILLLIITAPLQLMMGAIPGFNTLGKWIKELVVNLLPFSVIVILISLTGVILNAVAGNYQNFWMPPVIRHPLASADTIGAIISFGILLLLARVPDIIRNMFEQKPFEYGTAIGQALGAPAALGGKAIRSVAQTAESISDATGPQGWAKRTLGHFRSDGKKEEPPAKPGNLESIKST